MFNDIDEVGTGTFVRPVFLSRMARKVKDVYADEEFIELGQWIAERNAFLRLRQLRSFRWFWRIKLEI